MKGQFETELLELSEEVLDLIAGGTGMRIDGNG